MNIQTMMVHLLQRMVTAQWYVHLKDAQLIFAQYKNMRMTVVDMQSITAGEIIRSDITYNQDTDYYRIFVWENFDNIVPICPHF